MGDRTERAPVRELVHALGARLSDRGFRTARGGFALTRDGNVLRLELRRRRSRPDSVAVTFDATIESHRLAAWAKTIHHFIPREHRQYRLPAFAIGVDRWWTIQAGMQPEELTRFATEIDDLVGDALPGLLAQLPDTALRDLWRAEAGERELSDFEVQWLEVLDTALGPQDAKPADHVVDPTARSMRASVARLAREQGVTLSDPLGRHPEEDDANSHDSNATEVAQDALDAARLLGGKTLS